VPGYVYGDRWSKSMNCVLVHMYFYLTRHDRYPLRYRVSDYLIIEKSPYLPWDGSDLYLQEEYNSFVGVRL